MPVNTSTQLFGKSADSCIVLKINPYFCIMKKKQYTHPMILYPQRIKEEGIVVFNDARGLPFGDEPFVSSDYFQRIWSAILLDKKKPRKFRGLWC